MCQLKVYMQLEAHLAQHSPNAYTLMCSQVNLLSKTSKKNKGWAEFLLNAREIEQRVVFLFYCFFTSAMEKYKCVCFDIVHSGQRREWEVKRACEVCAFVCVLGWGLREAVNRMGRSFKARGRGPWPPTAALFT